MARLLTLLLMFALIGANGPAVATAMCQHEDARSHEQALQSADRGESRMAHAEESAATALSKKGSLHEAGAGLFQAAMLPADPFEALPPPARAGPLGIMDASPLIGRIPPPLHRPPLA